MRSVLDAEARAVALLRGRWRLASVTTVASLGTAAAFAGSLAPDDRARAVFEVLTFGAVLLPLIVGHGMVSGDLRSGVALLWLQKPVHPVPFYMQRALEVAALGVTLVLALWGVGVFISAPGLGLQGSRDLLAAVPGTVLMVVALCAMLFAFSAWGAPTDTLLVFAFFFGSLFSMLAGGPVGETLAWVALPVEPIRTLARFLVRRGGDGVGEALLLYLRFLAIWVATGASGLAACTRSPLPRDVSR